jgi:hypothetical protein
MMTKVDEMKKSFEDKLDKRAKDHQQRIENDIQSMREMVMKPSISQNERELHEKTIQFDHRMSESQNRRAPQKDLLALFSMYDHHALIELDQKFSDLFDLARYYSTDRLTYPTVFCETLEEFFEPMLSDYNISPQAKEIELKRLIADGRETAKKLKGGGIFGYLLPGQGCFLNGWLFVYGRNIAPKEAFQDSALISQILITAVHEKLGHGFLAAYSALGEVKTSLGLMNIELASRFGLRTSDDPLSSLRRRQHNLIFSVSIFLEEGWATWIETYLGQSMPEASKHPKYELQQVMEALKKLSVDNSEGGNNSINDELQAVLQGALTILFLDPDVNIAQIHAAVMVLQDINQNFQMEIMSLLGQPLIYAVGSLLMSQAEANMGAACVPYAALIAANVKFNFEEISLTDLTTLLLSDPSLYPDVRLAVLSRIKLEQHGSIKELAQRAQAELSFSVPQALK